MKSSIVIRTPTLIKTVALLALFSSASFSTSNIKETKHNLTYLKAGSLSSELSEEDEICIYCHVPSVNASVVTNALEWNKHTSVKPFILYGSTADGVTNNEISTNASLACLSCHDGVNAINVVVTTGTDGHTNPPTPIASNFSVSGFTPLNAWTDKKNHPVSIEYKEGIAGLKPTSTSLTGWSGSRQINDLLRDNKVECGSCHDPHEATNGTFLRIANSESLLCVGCHSK